LTRIDGAWEVHHLMVHQNPNTGEQEIISGEKIANSLDKSLRSKAKLSNTGFINTAIFLYQQRLSRGLPIRVQTTVESNLWRNYKQFIDYIVKKSNGDLIASEVENGIDPLSGKATVSIVIRKNNTGKFPKMNDTVKTKEAQALLNNTNTK
jgi:hypothetical protein